jgi:hypothetical protein
MDETPAPRIARDAQLRIALAIVLHAYAALPARVAAFAPATRPPIPA